MSAVEDAALLEEVAQIRVEMRANESAAAENGSESKQGFDATPAKLSKLKVCVHALVDRLRWIGIPVHTIICFFVNSFFRTP